MFFHPLSQLLEIKKAKSNLGLKYFSESTFQSSQSCFVKVEEFSIQVLVVQYRIFFILSFYAIDPDMKDTKINVSTFSDSVGT